MTVQSEKSARPSVAIKLTELALVALFGLVLALPTIWSAFVDDAYIHARIAEMFIETGRPYFNEGAAFKASSSTGYIFLLAAVGHMLDVTVAIRLVTGCSVVAIVLVGWIMVRDSEDRRWFSGLAMASSIPLILIAAYDGMETPTAVLFMISAALSWLRGRHGLAICLSAVAVWFRIEMALLLVLYVAAAAWEKRSPRPILHAWPVGILFILDYSLYGSVIPHAASVKSMAYGHEWLSSINNALRFGTRETLIGLAFCVLLFLRFADILRQRSVQPIADLHFVFAGGVLVSWMLGRANMFSWYPPLAYTPLVVGLVLLRSDSRKRLFVNTSRLVVAGYFLLSLEGVMRSLGVLENAKPRVEHYIAIGSRLYDFCPHCALVTSEIGGLGYGFAGTVYDAFGLGDPEAVQFHPMAVPEERPSESVGAIPAAYIPFRDPEFVVSIPIFSESARTSGALDRYLRYRCPFSVDGSTVIFGATGVDVFSKRTVPSDVFRGTLCSLASPEKLEADGN